MTTPQIIELRVALAIDRRRVQLQAEAANLSEPFPYLELTIIDPDDNEVARTLVMGVMEPLTQMVMHLRPPAVEDETRAYRARGRLFFGEEGEEETTFSTRETAFRFPKQ